MIRFRMSAWCAGYIRTLLRKETVVQRDLLKKRQRRTWAWIGKGGKLRSELEGEASSGTSTGSARWCSGANANCLGPL
jgi:hypothetical protein